MLNVVETLARAGFELDIERISKHFPAKITCQDFIQNDIPEHSRFATLEQLLHQGEKALECWDRGEPDGCTESYFISSVPEKIVDLQMIIGQPEDIRKRLGEFQKEYFSPALGSVLKPHSSGKSFEDLFAEYQRAEIRANPLMAKEILYGYATDEVFDPEVQEEFHFISNELSRVTDPVFILEELYGNYEGYFYRVPSKLLKVARFKELKKSGGYHRSIDFDTAKDEDEFNVLGSQALEFAIKQEETDDASMMEALTVFVRTMPLDDAVNSARIL